jgi:uncharacterized protein (TIGR03084 family)
VADLAGVLADLADEGDTLDELLSTRPAEDWSRLTPAPGWTVAQQVGHLAWTDDIARLAAAEPDAFQLELSKVASAWEGYVDRAAAERAAGPPEELLASWRASRRALADALRRVPESVKLPWFGPPMSPTSMATARLMETWAHSQDVFDALGVEHFGTDRLRHIAHIGVRTRDFAFLVNDRTLPTEPFRVELVGPFGDLWTWGPHDAAQQVAGPALDFCLLVTQRRNRADLAVVAVGADADAWLDIAQAFAGPPGEGRAPSGDAT